MGTACQGHTRVAPRAWAFVAGAVIALVVLLSRVEGALTVAGVAVAALLVAYFVVGYIRDSARNRHVGADDGPDATWSTTGPFT